MRQRLDEYEPCAIIGPCPVEITDGQADILRADRAAPESPRAEAKQATSPYRPEQVIATEGINEWRQIQTPPCIDSHPGTSHRVQTLPGAIQSGSHGRQRPGVVR